MSKEFENNKKDWHMELSEKLGSIPPTNLRRVSGKHPISMQASIRLTAEELSRKIYTDDPISQEEVDRINRVLEEAGYDKTAVRTADLGLLDTDARRRNVLHKTVSENLSSMEDDYISREDFCEIFGEVDKVLWSQNFEHNGVSFKCFLNRDMRYMLHLDSGTLIGYYDHLGRANNCSKPLNTEELILFKELLMKELSGVTLDPDDVISQEDLEYLVDRANSARFIDKDESKAAKYLERLQVSGGKYDLINDSHSNSVYYYVCGISPHKDKVYEVAVNIAIAERIPSGEILIHDSNKLAEITGLPSSLLTSKE